MGLVSMLDTMLTFTFMIPACLIAVAITYGVDYLAKQEAEEKRISPVAASLIRCRYAELWPVNTVRSRLPVPTGIICSAA